jgi:hypothetical protein
LLHLHRILGVSPSSIRKIRNEIEDLVLEYKQQQEGVCPKQGFLEIVGGVDETFFEKMILILMDLRSGYIFLEEESEERTYETWMEKVQNIIDKFGVTIRYLVSDRAKALIKLAEKGIGCLSIPDLFHASHELVKLFGLSLGRKKASIEKKLTEALAKLAILKELSKDIDQQQSVVDQLKKEQEFIETGISTYRELLHKVSKIVHPFDVNNAQNQTSAQVQAQLAQLVFLVIKLRGEYEIDDKNKRVDKFRKQIEAIASLIDAWWLWVEETLKVAEIDDELKQWLMFYLLPTLYWQSQVAKTKTPELRKSYQAAFDTAQASLGNHPMTSTFLLLREWQDWAIWMVSNFQRATSSVEGRNGCLSQIHHNGRGITLKRQKVLTVIHNYYLTRHDGTTAAERLFGTKFPDLFEWIVQRIDALPLARASGKEVALTP